MAVRSGREFVERGGEQADRLQRALRGQRGQREPHHDRHPRPHVGQVGEGLPEVSQRGERVGQGQRPGQLDAGPGLLGRVLAGVQHPAEVAHGGLGRAPVLGAERGVPQHPEHPGLWRLGQQEQLVGDLLGRAARVVEQPGGPHPQPLDLVGAVFGEHQGAQRVVLEVDLPRRDQGQLPQGAHGRGGQLRRHAGERGQKVGADLVDRAAEHGRGAGHRLDVVGLTGQPGQHRGGQRVPAHLGRPAHPGRGRPHPLPAQLAEQPGQQQRVAGGDLGAAALELGIDRRAQHQRGQVGHVAFGQRPDVEDLAAGLGQDLGEHRAVRPRGAGALGQQHQQRQTVRAPQQEVQPAQGALVTPVHVVDHDDQRPG